MDDSIKMDRRVLAHLRRHPDLRSEEVQEVFSRDLRGKAANAEKARVRASLERLRERAEVKVRGKTRGTRYRAA